MTKSPAFDSPEYQLQCQRLQAECTRLQDLAASILCHKAELETACITRTVRKELASGSTLHRGFYCPSPTYDIIVGNTHRGKILKRVTSRSNPTHEYGFDADGHLLYCKWLRDHAVCMTEYLVRIDRAVYGITLDNHGCLCSITEEIYRNGRLVSYLYGLCLPFSDGPRCCEVTCEYYGYDEAGLESCQIHHILFPPENIPAFLEGMERPGPQRPIYRQDNYVFQRKDGYLSSYSNGKHTYQVYTQRKA